MVRPTNLTIQGILVIAILAFYGKTLADSVSALHEQQASSKLDTAMVFQSGGGVDIFGKVIDFESAPAATRTIFFILHNSSIQKDLDFWQQVETLLPSDAALRLVGYCDGDKCADAVRHGARPDFPVIEYGDCWYPGTY